MAGEWLNGLDHQWLRPTQSDGTFMRAMQLGMQMRHQRVSEEIAMRELEGKMQMMEANKTLREAQIYGMEQSAKGNAELATVLAETSDNWTDPQAKAKFWGTAAKYPHVMKTPQFKELVDNFQLADTAKARADYLQSQIGGREDLESLKFEHREALLNEKYARLAELQEDSQEARAMRDEIQHEHKLIEDERKPRSQSGVGRFDLKWTDQAAMKAELDAITRDPFNMKPEEKAKRIEGVYRKYKAIAAENQPKAPAQQKVLKFNPATGTFE